MKKIAILMIFLLAFLIACGGESVSETTYVNYSSEAIGISFEYPEGWATDEGEGEINVASDAQLLSADTQSFSSGGVANITTLPIEFITDDAAATLNQFATLMAETDDASVASEATQMTINGRDAAQTTLNVSVEGDEATMLVTLIVGESQAVLIAAAYDEANFGEILEHIASSMTLSK